MKGTLILESRGGWKTALPFVLAAVAAVLADLPTARHLPDAGAFARSALLAAMTYIWFRLFYYAFSLLLPKDERSRTVEWTLTEDTLTLDGEAIPRKNIRQVHCWPNRDALGFDHGGWKVNLEMAGGNRLLRSVKEGPAAEISARQLRELVEALGYGSRWPAEPAKNETEDDGEA